MRFTLLFLFFSFSIYSQIIVSGKAIDKQTNEGIPYVSIGIMGKAVGTVSDENGNFSITLKNAIDTDILKISAIGYGAVTYKISEAKNFLNKSFYLSPQSINLAEVAVKPQKTITKVLGNKKYNKNVYCNFQGIDSSYLGVEAAIRAKNKPGREVWIEDFNFFINKNTLKDSVMFRLNFYAKNEKDMPGENILKEPIVFKTGIKYGIVHLDLKSYLIHTNKDFFISLECLTENVKQDLSFSGAIKGPSYFKMATFADWEKMPLMGLDFNVTVTYQK